MERFEYLHHCCCHRRAVGWRRTKRAVDYLLDAETELLRPTLFTERGNRDLQGSQLIFYGGKSRVIQVLPLILYCAGRILFNSIILQSSSFYYLTCHFLWSLLATHPLQQ